MWLLWLLSAGLIALDGFDFFIIGVALPFLKRDFGLGATLEGAVAVAAIAGSLAGSLTLGAITDRVGRQIMLLADVIIFILATAGTALAWSPLSLIVFRFLVGVGIGADYPISVSYITENVPARVRGPMTIGAFTFQAVGALLGAVTGIIIINLFQHFYPDSTTEIVRYGWRWMLGVGLVLAIAVAILRFSFLLESPSYYIKKGDYESASEAASTLLGETVQVTPQSDPPREDSGLGYDALFSSRYRRNTAFASIPWFLQDIATYGIGIFTPIIVATLAFVEQSDFVAKELSSTTASAFIDGFLIIGFLIAVLLVDRVGRIKLQISGFIGMAIGLSLLGLESIVTAEGSSNIPLIFIGFFVFNLMMNAGPNATTFLLSGEVFPSAIRGSGAGFAAAFAKLGAVLGTFALPIVEESLGVPALMFILAGICALGAAITYGLRVDTSIQEKAARQ